MQSRACVCAIGVRACACVTCKWYCCLLMYLYISAHTCMLCLQFQCHTFPLLRLSNHCHHSAETLCRRVKEPHGTLYHQSPRRSNDRSAVLSSVRTKSGGFLTPAGVVRRQPTQNVHVNINEVKYYRLRFN